MVVLDTSALCAAMHRLPAAMLRLRRMSPSDLVLCTPAVAEIRFGLERLPPGSRRRRLLERELSIVREAVRWADWSEPAASEFGRIKATLEQRGQRIDDMDVAIAAIASGLDAAVATCNLRHFERIDDLVVQDWSAAP